GLAVARQQAHELLFYVLPESGLGRGQADGRFGRCRVAQHLAQLRRAFAHAHVVVLDALARQPLYAVPVARFEQRLGALRAITEQRIVAVEAGQDLARDLLRLRRGRRSLFNALDVAAVDHGTGQYRCGQAVSANSSRPISMRRISLVPAPISYSLASRHRRPVGYSLI